MKFQNNTGANVFLDLGGFKLVLPQEIIELEGHPTCPPLTPILSPEPPKPKKAKVKKAPAKKKAVKES